MVTESFPHAHTLGCHARQEDMIIQFDVESYLKEDKTNQGVY